MSLYKSTTRGIIDSKTNTKHLFIFSDEKKMKISLNDFKGADIHIFYIGKDDNVNLRYDDMLVVNPNYAEYDTLVTDSKSHYKKWVGKKSFLFKKEKSESTKLFVDRGEYEKINLNYEIGDHDIFDLIKKSKINTHKIVSYKNDKISAAIKIHGSWRYFSPEEIEILYSLKKGLSISTNHGNLPIFNKTKSVNENSKIVNGKIVFIKNNTDIEEKINWIINEYFFFEVKSLYEQNKFYDLNYNKFDTTKSNFEKFSSKLENSIQMPGIEFNSYEIIDENKIILNTKFGVFKIIYDDDLNKVEVLANLSGKNEEDLRAFSNGFIVNIKNTINNIYSKNRMPSKKNITLASISIVILLLLFVITFKYIYSMDTIETGFRVIFSHENFSNPWIYVVLSTTVLSFFWPLLVGAFYEKFILKKEKLEFNRLLTFFYAGMLRKLALFLTANLMIALFVWGWYIKRRNNVKISSLVSTVAWSKIIRAIVYSVIGTLFMISGTVGYFTQSNLSSTEVKKAILIFAISWIGFLWEIIHSTLIYILVFTPILYSFLNYFILKIKFFGKDLTRSYVDNSYRNTQTMLNKMKGFRITEHRKTLIRFSILITGPILIEGIETIMYFNMFEDIFATDPKIYWNFITLSGLRLTSNNLHNFPIINMLPGNGLVFTEYGLTTLYESVFSMKHYGELNPWGLYTSTDLAEMTSFATRFFNVYLVNAIVLVSSIFIIGYEFILRKVRING